MFEFQHPAWLLLMLLLPLVFWRRTRRTSGVRWSSFSVLSRKGSLRVAMAWLPSALEFVGLTLAVFALARPQLVEVERVVSSEGIDIVLALDVSGSMEAADFNLGGRPVDRLSAAKKVVSDFVKSRDMDRVGLVVFGEEAFTQVPLTLDHEALDRFLSNVRIGMAGANQTAIGEAIAIAGRQLGRLEAPSKVLVLLTDGRNNAGSINPMQAAEAASSLGVTIYTVGVGSNGGGGFFRRSEEVDETTLTRVAEATGGRYFRARDTTGLASIYATIDELEMTTAEVSEYRSVEELYRKFLAFGLLALFLQWCLGESWLRRLP